jgi:K+ transporter
MLGGLWVLLISWVALQAGKLSRVLNYLGIVIAVAGIMSALPGLGEVGLIFGLVQIVWFIWLGVVMLRSSTSAAA